MKIAAQQAAVTGTRPVAAGRPRQRSLRRVSVWFLLPALAVYSFVLLYPMASGLRFAFTDWDGLNPNYAFVGLDNFTRLAGDPQVRSALKMTFVFAIAVASLQNVAGLALAIALNRQLRTRQLLRLLFFLPVVLTPLIVAVLWKYLYSTGGPVNLVIAALGGEALNWLGNPTLAAISIIVVTWWQSVGLSMVIYLAGLQSIPEELHEAARMDGATSWQNFRFVTLPMLAPAITVTVVYSIITSLKFFDQIWVMTAGGPGYATETLSTLIYKTAFRFFEMGYGSAISVVFTFVVGVIVLLSLNILRAREIDNG
jgi:raffinose/stachyose/melibiose transport system permease protein